MKKEMKTKHCPKCDSQNISSMWGGTNVTREQKKEMFCLDCDKIFLKKDIIIRQWITISPQKKKKQLDDSNKQLVHTFCPFCCKGFDLYPIPKELMLTEEHEKKIQQLKEHYEYLIDNMES